MGVDLGTYHLRVTLKDGRQFIQTTVTGSRWTNGRGSTSPASAKWIPPTWDSDQEFVDSQVFMYTDGNFGCDCNLNLFWADANQVDRDEDPDCGDTNPVVALDVMRPNSERFVEIYREESSND